MQHIPSIAFSSCNYDENADLSPLRDGVTRVVKMVLEKGLPKYIELRHTKAPYIYFYCITLWKTSV